MPPAEAQTRSRAVAPAVSTTVSGWGGGPSARVAMVSPRNVSELSSAVEQAHDLHHRHLRTGALPRGCGRSYGDAAQLNGGLAIDTRHLTDIDFDRTAGLVTAQAGVTVGSILKLCAPAGWLMPVVPGTQHVSVGGAVAADVHGKNHGHRGTLGRHVTQLALLTADGVLRQLTPEDELFGATLGGMGLTGVVVSAQIQLQPAPGAQLLVDSDRVDGLAEALAALKAPGGEHRVAWLDLLGQRPGRGLVTRAGLTGAPAPRRDASATVSSRATVPARWPGGLLTPSTVRAFNELRFRRAPRRERGRREDYGRHMFPLDALDAWPRLYGQPGFVQYQFVVPTAGEGALEQVVAELRRAKVPCYLAVLKDLGPAGGAPLSFPIEGWTLALDLPGAAPGLDRALDRCDELVAAVGGRVYLAKDGRLRAEAARAMYPRLDEWRHIRDQVDPDGLWCSDQAVRTGLVPERR